MIFGVQPWSSQQVSVLLEGRRDRFRSGKQFLILHGEAVIYSCDLLFLSPWRSREKEIVISCEVLFLIKNSSFGFALVRPERPISQ